jgi:cysteine synthase
MMLHVAACHLIAFVCQVKTASISNPEHYVNIARKLASDTPGAVFMDQFESEANFKVMHQLNTVLSYYAW